MRQLLVKTNQVVDVDIAVIFLQKRVLLQLVSGGIISCVRAPFAEGLLTDR